MTVLTKPSILRCMSDNEEHEHALSLLRELKDWTGLRAIVPIDAVCRFGKGTERCNAPLRNVVVFQSETECKVIALCNQHTNVMDKAIELWRAMQ